MAGDGLKFSIFASL